MVHAHLSRLVLLILSGFIAMSLTASEMIITPGPEGQVNATLVVANPLFNSVPPSPQAGLFLVIAPCDVLPEQKVDVPTDVRVARIDAGAGFVVFTVMAPGTLQTIPIRVTNCTRATETSEGKAQIALNFTYPFMSSSQHASLQATNVVANWDVRILLPHEYDSKELSFSPAAMRRPDGRTFELEVTTSHPVDLWVVYPNPSQQRLSTAKVVASLLFGFLTLILQVPALKARRVGTLLAVLGVSVALLGVSAYYTLKLAKRRDFIEWSAALIPHASFALGAAVYVLIAKRRQAAVSGLVLIDQQPALFADVILYHIQNGNRREAKRVDTLDDGRYRFFVWCRRSPTTVVVSAGARGATAAQSEPQSFKAGERVDVPPLLLNRLPVAQPAVGGQQGG